MTKTAYLEHNVIKEIESAICLLCEQNGSCTPTDVLRVLGFEESCLTRTLVCNIALMLEFPVVSSGRGYKILDW